MGLLNYWHSFKTRRKVILIVGSWIDEARKNQVVPSLDDIWQTAYMRGFLPRILVGVALHEALGRLDNNQISLLQHEIWRELTGLTDDFIGQDITFFDGGRDDQFSLGVKNASHFLETLYGTFEGSDLHLDADIEEIFSQVSMMGEDSDAFAQMAPHFIDMSVDAEKFSGNSLASLLFVQYFNAIEMLNQ